MTDTDFFEQRQLLQVPNAHGDDFATGPKTAESIGCDTKVPIAMGRMSMKNVSENTETPFLMNY